MTWTTRRKLLGGIAALGGAYGLGLATPKIVSFFERLAVKRAVLAVLPQQPIPTGLDLGPPTARLVEAGAIDPDKFMKAVGRYGRVPVWVSRALEGKQQELVLSLESAPYALNLLWPLGLATKAAFNAESPIRGAELANFASTGGWILGKAENGAAYFDAVETLNLTPEEAETVRRLADGTFRPCCGNSAFFQDCNHGSAMLGLMELAAASGRGEAEIWKLAKTANGFWYPEQYVEIALYFDAVEGMDWSEVPPQRALSAEFSSSRGFEGTVRAALARKGYPVIRPPAGPGCAV